MMCFLISCTTIEYVKVPLPEINFIRPIRPMLEEVQEDVPITATINTVKLMSYSEQLEIYADNWENFYEDLRNDED